MGRGYKHAAAKGGSTARVVRDMLPGKYFIKLETVSIAEPLQNRQHAQNP